MFPFYNMFEMLKRVWKWLWIRSIKICRKYTL